MEKKLLALVLAALLVSVGAGVLIVLVGEREEDPTDFLAGTVDLFMSFVAAVALTGRLIYEAYRDRRARRRRLERGLENGPPPPRPDPSSSDGEEDPLVPNGGD